jgi:hypothetical protein
MACASSETSKPERSLRAIICTGGSMEGLFEGSVQEIGTATFQSALCDYNNVSWKQQVMKLRCSSNNIRVIWDGLGILLVRGRREMHIKFWWGNMEGRGHFEGLCLSGIIISKSILHEDYLRVWTGLIWLRRGTGGGLLWTRCWSFGFLEMWSISWLTKEVFASQEGLYSMELGY